MASGFLKVSGTNVVDDNGNAVILRGAAIGGWMNLENFITGFPGHESQHRAAMLRVLGREKYEYFFDKWLEYFFTAKDARFFANLGLNYIRIPFNYRHFEDDMNPMALKVEGFKHLDRVIDLCAKEDIYTILDLHAAPGSQNGDWHSDNATSHASFWDHRHFQDRTVWLWEQIVERYRNNPWVAGYNPLNEPADPLYVRLPAFYERLEKAIRKIDSKHILWLDGNTYSIEWKEFDNILPNCVYTIHDYSSMGFPFGARYKGTPEQNENIKGSYARKTVFMNQHKVPIWNGEFGPVYSDPRIDSDATEINQDRYNLLERQLRLYEEHKISRSIRIYKDIGVQGMIYTSPDSPWNRLIQPFLDKKKKLQIDGWGTHPSAEPEAALAPLVKWIDEVGPTVGSVYPKVWPVRRKIQRAVFHTLLADSFSDEFADLFKGLGKVGLHALARSFHFDQCQQREGLNEILRKSAR